LSIPSGFPISCSDKRTCMESQFEPRGDPTQRAADPTLRSPFVPLQRRHAGARRQGFGATPRDSSGISDRFGAIMAGRFDNPPHRLRLPLGVNESKTSKLCHKENKKVMTCLLRSLQGKSRRISSKVWNVSARSLPSPQATTKGFGYLSFL
jgi:hypothetical protein